MGKGDSYRPVNKERYDRNYDMIFNRRDRLERMPKQDITVNVDYPSFVDCLRNAITEVTPEQFNLLHAAVGLSGESGELLDMVKKHVFQTHGLDKEEVKKELGDILFYLQFMCNVLGTTIDEVRQGNIVKLTERYLDQKFDPERSKNRKE